MVWSTLSTMDGMRAALASTSSRMRPDVDDDAAHLLRHRGIAQERAGRALALGQLAGDAVEVAEDLLQVPLGRAQVLRDAGELLQRDLHFPQGGEHLGLHLLDLPQHLVEQLGVARGLDLAPS
jgi:hypothetical protein